nr:hypothetical protein [uncultured Pseudogulbenkiania sp.]
MLIFLDTEFADFADREPISIGMVSEDGRHVFYAELQDFDRDCCNTFVRSTVWPLLGQIEGVTVKRIDLGVRLRAWFTTLPRSVTIACDSQFDREVLGAVIGGQWPTNLTGWFDLRPLIDTTAFDQAVSAYHDQPDRPWHHALHDAHAHRAGWLAWIEQRRRDGLR